MHAKSRKINFSTKLIFWVFLYSLFSLIGFGQLYSAENVKKAEIKRIAVKEFDSDDSKLNKMLAEWAISVLMDKKDYKVIERILLNQILKEQELSLSGAINQATLAKIGEIDGASHILFGTVGKIGEKYLLTLKIVEVNSAETIESYRGSTGKFDAIPELLTSLINKEKFQEVKEARKHDANRKITIHGVWDGFFQYDDPKRGYMRGNFSFNLDQKAPTYFEGKITEPRTDFGPREAFLSSKVLNGVFDSSTNELSFIKRYDYDGHAVEYHGTLIGEDIVTGRWNIGGYTGSWRALRRK